MTMKLGSTGITTVSTIRMKRFLRDQMPLSTNRYLRRLPYTENVKYFLCVKQELVSIDVTKCPTLSTLHVSRNKFKTLDLSNCPNLRYLYLNSNEVSALDLKNKPELLYVECVMNNLSKETMMKLAEDLADRTGLEEDGTEKSTGNIYVVALLDTEKMFVPKRLSIK